MFGLGGREMLFVLVALLLYFVPSVIAARRKHQNARAIIVLNVLLGWTLLGWVAALVWSLTEVRAPQAGAKETTETTPKAR